MDPRCNRRQFLQASAGSLATAALFVAGDDFARGQVATARATKKVNGVSPALRKFITPLRTLGPSGIPVAAPDTTTYPGVDYYRIAIGQFTEQLHPDLPGPTRLYGYWDLTNPVKRHLGGAIVARSGRPVRVRYTHAAALADQLPARHILPLDTSVMGAEAGQPQNRASVHLHGGFVPWTSDGGPFHWTTPNGGNGPSVVPWLPDAAGALTTDNWYPNTDSARMLFYHDHAMGITRLNVYAGLASAYVLRDAWEQSLIDTGAIPGKIPGTEIPLVFQDRTFKRYADAWGSPGSLWYPSAYDTAMFPLGPGLRPLPSPSGVPEFFGDTMLVNGTPYPFFKVEPRRYRLRILNACQSAFLNLQLYYAGSTDTTVADTRSAGPSFLQIGTEGGFLPQAVVLPQRRLTLDRVTGNPVTYTLLLGPAERADVIVDFSKVPVGAKLVLFNDATGPFPMGTMAPIPPTGPGQGPDTMNLMQFQVVAPGTVTGVASADPPVGKLILPAMYALPTRGAVVRDVALYEGMDQYGRIMPQLGTLNGGPLGCCDPATETPRAGSVEIWNIYNLTADAHPVHIHLVNFQVLGRARIDTMTGAILGGFRKADANESGWKDTVRANFGEVVRVIMRFDLPSAPVPVPRSPSTGGYDYVWHCHILEHEDHDMMRPLVVR